MQTLVSANQSARTFLFILFKKTYKMAMNWAQVTQKKQQQAQVYVSTIYFYIYAYISTF